MLILKCFVYSRNSLIFSTLKKTFQKSVIFFVKIFAYLKKKPYLSCRRRRSSIVVYLLLILFIMKNISFKSLIIGQVLESELATITILDKVSAHTEYKGQQAYILADVDGLQVKLTMAQLCSRYGFTNEGTTFTGATTGKRAKIYTDTEIDGKCAVIAQRIDVALKTLEGYGLITDNLRAAADDVVLRERRRMIEESIAAQAAADEKAAAAAKAAQDKAAAALAALTPEQLASLLAAMGK